MAMAKIDVGGMCEVVRGLEEGILTLTDARSALRSTLDRFDLDITRSWAVRPAEDWARAELPGVRRRLALAQALEGSNPSWPVGTVELEDEVGISQMDPVAAEAAGRELALSLVEGGEPTEEQLDLLEQMSGDPYFASGFAKAVTADELAGILTGLSYSRTPRGQCLDDADYADLNSWYTRFVVAASDTLGTATRATGDLALPAGYAQGWVDVMTAEVQSGPGPGGTGIADHANALGLLLTSGKFSLSFLGTVADGVYDYERAFQEDYPGEVWGPRGGDASTARVIYDQDGWEFRDPMAGIMAALGNNPAAAQNFFAGGDTVTVEIDGQDLVVSDRLNYLICDKTWAVDPSNGGSLGEALVAASTVFRDRAGTGMISAQIASQTFALIGEKTGEGADGGFLGIGADSGWQMWDGMRPYVAQMLASYGADVFDAKVTGTNDLATGGWYQRGSGVLFPDDMPYGVTLNLEGVEKIIATLGENQDDFAPFLAGMFQAGNLVMDTGLHRGMDAKPSEAGGYFLTGGISDNVSSSMTNTATVVGWALDTGYKGDKTDEAMQKKRAAAVADALNLITDAPFLPTIKLESLKWGVERLEDLAVGGVQQSAPTDAAATYDELDSQAREDLTVTVMNLLLRNGYLDQVASDWVAGHGGVFKPPPEGAIEYSDTGDPLYFKMESKEYQNWIATSGLATLTAERVVGVFMDQVGVGGS